jgi:hypothetical protein
MRPEAALIGPQTLYIYFGVAVLVGTVAGAVLSYTNVFLVRILGASQEAEVKGRTLAAYRREKAQRLAEKEKHALPHAFPPRISAPLAAEWMKQEVGPESAGLLSTTIMEEEDDSSGADL